jgi:hypothetical protein
MVILTLICCERKILFVAEEQGVWLFSLLEPNVLGLVSLVFVSSHTCTSNGFLLYLSFFSATN